MCASVKDSIELIEIPPVAPQMRNSKVPGALNVVLDAHRREGFDAGYRRAITDVLAATVFVAEKAIRQSNADSPETRRAIYAFIEMLERETIRLRKDESFEQGGGI